jgi:membrane carboxypeptidase/penicillin-binding protein
VSLGRKRTRQRGVLILGAIVLALVGLLLIGLLVLGAMALWYSQDLPSLEKATDYRPRQHLQVLTSEGAEIAQFGT